MLLAMVSDEKCGTKFEKVGDFVPSNRSDVPVRLDFTLKSL